MIKNIQNHLKNLNCQLINQQRFNLNVAPQKKKICYQLTGNPLQWHRFPSMDKYHGQASVTVSLLCRLQALSKYMFQFIPI